MDKWLLYTHSNRALCISILLFKIDFTCISHSNIFITCDVIHNKRVSFWIPIGTNNYAILNYMRRDYVVCVVCAALPVSAWDCGYMRAWTSTLVCISSSLRYFILCHHVHTHTMTMQNNNITSDATYFKSQIALNQPSLHWTLLPSVYTTKMLDITQQRLRRIYRKIITVPGKEYQTDAMCMQNAKMHKKKTVRTNIDKHSSRI